MCKILPNNKKGLKFFVTFLCGETLTYVCQKVHGISVDTPMPSLSVIYNQDIFCKQE